MLWMCWVWGLHKLEKLKREKLVCQKGIKKAQTKCGTFIRISKCRQESVGKGENTKHRRCDQRWEGTEHIRRHSIAMWLSARATEGRNGRRVWKGHSWQTVEYKLSSLKVQAISSRQWGSDGGYCAEWFNKINVVSVCSIQGWEGDWLQTGKLV